MKKENFDAADITSLSKLADVLRKREKKETLEERMLRSYTKATIWDHGKKVVENGRVIDVGWLKKKLEKIRGRRHVAEGPSG